MRYNFPRIRFADISTVGQQLKHIESEFVEAAHEYNSGRMDLCDLEVMDIYQSCETYFRIREKQGISINEVDLQTYEKNKARGYYDAES